MNTMADLGHPLILDTAKNLAFKQVGLGFCKPQDHQDLVQELLLYLCRQFSRYTGALPLITWACRLLRGRINAINRRLLGVPSPSQQRRSRQASAAAPSSNLKPVPTPSAEQTDGHALAPPVAHHQQAQPTVSPTAEPVAIETAKPETRSPRAQPPTQEPPERQKPHLQPESPPPKTQRRPRLFALCAEVRSWWQRQLNRWQRPP